MLHAGARYLVLEIDRAGSPVVVNRCRIDVLQIHVDYTEGVYTIENGGNRRIAKAGLGVFLVAGSLAAAEPPGATVSGVGIAVGEPVLVSRERKGIPHVEPYLAAHPSDPDLLFGAAVSLPEPQPRGGFDASIVVGFSSSDGGRSWTSAVLPACRIDPWVRFGRESDVFVSCLGREGSPVVVYRSPDGGRTWRDPLTVPSGGGGGADRPVLAVDGRETLQAESVYAVFGQWFPPDALDGRLFGPAVARSTPGEEGFSPPVFLRHDRLVQQPIDAAVLSDGTLLVVFMDFATRDALLAHRRTWIVRSPDGGRTFSIPALVREQVGSEMPWAMAVDPSVHHRDRIFVAVDGVWKREGARPEDLGEGATNLFVITSDDRGETWSAPVTVTDAPGANAETPAIAVNADGVVGVAWYDTRNDPSTECFDLYFSVSLDGGESFLPGVRVTPETSCPRSIEQQRGLARRWPFGGDYSGLAAGADGRFHLFWTDSRDGVYQVWTATVDLAEADEGGAGNRTTQRSPDV